MQTLVETKTLSGQRGAYSLARPIDTIEVPATVEAVLALASTASRPKRNASSR